MHVCMMHISMNLDPWPWCVYIWCTNLWFIYPWSWSLRYVWCMGVWCTYPWLLSMILMHAWIYDACIYEKLYLWYIYDVAEILSRTYFQWEQQQESHSELSRCRITCLRCQGVKFLTIFMRECMCLETLYAYCKTPFLLDSIVVPLFPLFTNPNYSETSKLV